MRRFFEYGSASAGVLTLIYLGLTFLLGLPINLQTIGLCIGGGLLSGLFVFFAFSYFSPGEVIHEGEEDDYID